MLIIISYDITDIAIFLEKIKIIYKCASCKAYKLEMILIKKVSNVLTKIFNYRIGRCKLYEYIKLK